MQIHNIIVNCSEHQLAFYDKLSSNVYETVDDFVSTKDFAGHCSLHTHQLIIDGLSNYGVNRLKKLKEYIDLKIEKLENGKKET